MVTWGSGGAIIGKTIFKIYLEKNLQNQQANFNKTWYKSFGKWNSKLFKERARSSSQGR
jgi:hypothetical protein